MKLKQYLTSALCVFIILMQFAWILHEVHHVNPEVGQHQEILPQLDGHLEHSQDQDKKPCRICLGLSHIAVSIGTSSSPIEWLALTLAKPISSDHYISSTLAREPSSRDPPSHC
jgi:hypothetical protein